MIAASRLAVASACKLRLADHRGRSGARSRQGQLKTINVVVNIQIGFTTEPKHRPSSDPAATVADMLRALSLHVSGGDQEAAAQVVRRAVDSRFGPRRQDPQ